MCGIAGIFRRSDPAAVKAMLDRMSHRGPDDEGIFYDECVTLGHRRLAIIDTSPGGHQPMSRAEGDIQIVYNGEIYNYLERRRELQAQGVAFKSESDTEVILALYERYGIECLRLLRGIFALAIYDRRGGTGNEVLYLARDHFGIKPLLYAETPAGLVFASELKGMLASGLVAREVDSESLRQFLSLGSVYQPRTLVAGVKALPSGHYRRVDRHGSSLTRYWDYKVDRVESFRHQPYEWQKEALRSVLVDSVRRQMVADVPVGAFLSGGVDSALIVALMSKETNRQVKTFSVGFEQDAAAADESSDAAETARIIGTEHYPVVVGRSDILSHIGKFVRGLDQPSIDGFNAYFVSYVTAQHVTVALSGTGGDEVFLGYPWFASIGQQFGLAPLDPAADPSGSERLRQAFGGLHNLFGPQAADQILAADHRQGSCLRVFSDDLAGNDELADAGTLDRSSALCLNGYTRNQLLRDIDACSMVHSLEVRVPFLDPVVVDFAMSLPSEAKIRMNDRTLDPDASYDQSGVKRILCDVARSYLPPEFFANRSKKGFSLPFADWLRGPLANVVAETLSPVTVRAAGLFDPGEVTKIYSEFQQGQRAWSQPWALMIAELWRRAVLLA